MEPPVDNPESLHPENPSPPLPKALPDAPESIAGLHLPPLTSASWISATLVSCDAASVLPPPPYDARPPWGTKAPTLGSAGKTPQTGWAGAPRVPQTKSSKLRRSPAAPSGELALGIQGRRRSYRDWLSLSWICTREWESPWIWKLPCSNIGVVVPGTRVSGSAGTQEQRYEAKWIVWGWQGKCVQCFIAKYKKSQFMRNWYLNVLGKYESLLVCWRFIF